MLTMKEFAPASVTEFSRVYPGQIFERPNAEAPAKAYRYLRLKNGRAVNLFSNDLEHVGKTEQVKVIGVLL